MAGPRAHRGRVEVGGDDPALRSDRLRTVQVSAPSRRRHLPHLFGDTLGAPSRRVAILLDLSGQGAGPPAPQAPAPHPPPPPPAPQPQLPPPHADTPDRPLP